MRRCVKCKGQLKSVQAEDAIPVGEHEVTVTMPAKRCGACGEIYFEGKDLERAELAVASQLLNLGVATGAAFRFMRKALGLRAVDLAKLLDVDAVTISRWENDKVPVDRATLATLAAAASEKLDGRDATLARLRRLHEGKRPARALRVDVARAS